MKVVAVSMVKNEADVIEPFVRHTGAFVDSHLIFDHLSTDGTGFILKKLQREGLPLAFFHDDRPEYLQTHRTHQLLSRALHDHGADWVVPLDADEFLQAEGGPATFRARLADLLAIGQPFRMWMRDYLATAQDDSSEPNPVKRLTRRATAPHSAKAALPRAFALQPDAGWTDGNHAPRLGAQVVESPVLDDLWLAHLTCRSASHAMIKVVQYRLRRLAEGKWHTVGDNYVRQFRQLATFPRPLLEDPWQYGHGESGEEAPAWYHGGPLGYAPVLTATESAIVAVLSAAECVAADHGKMLETFHSLAPSSGWLARLRWLWQRLVHGVNPDSLPRPVEQLAPRLREGLVLPDSRSTEGLAGELTVDSLRAAGDRIEVSVRIRNSGICTWLHRTPDTIGAVRLGVQLVQPDGTIVNRDFHRAELPFDIEPGDEATVHSTIPVPADPEAILGFDLVAEGLRWFGERSCRMAVAGTAAGGRRRACVTA